MKLRRALLAAALFTCAAPAALAQNELWPVWRAPAGLPGSTPRLATTADGGLIIASTAGSLGDVRAFDSLGATRWTTPLPLVAGEARSVAVLANGDVAVLVQSGADYAVSRFTANGALVGTQSYGGAGAEEAEAIAAHPSGGYVVVGSSDGGYGTPTTSPPGVFGGFVALHDAQGAELWVRRFDAGSTSVNFRASAVTPSGDIRAFGYSFDWLDPYRKQASASVSPGGAVQSSTLFGTFGEFRWASSAPGQSVFTDAKWHSGAGWGAGAQLRRTTPQGATTSWFLGEGLGGEALFHAAIDDGQGGIYAWVTDNDPTWFGQPAFVGLYRYNSAGQIVWSQADANVVRTAVPLRFGEVVTATTTVQRLSRGDVGTQGCAGQPNSTGAPAVLRLAGSASLSANALVPFASNLPPNVATLCAISRNAGFVAPFAGGQGTLCLAAPIGRSTVVTSSNEGRAAYRIDLTAMPTPLGPQAAQIGDTWRFQVWYRDTAGGGTTNLTSSVSVVVQ
jgi:hypothetical protein